MIHITVIAGGIGVTARIYFAKLTIHQSDITIKEMTMMTTNTNNTNNSAPTNTNNANNSATSENRELTNDELNAASGGIHFRKAGENPQDY